MTSPLRTACGPPAPSRAPRGAARGPLRAIPRAPRYRVSPPGLARVEDDGRARHRVRAVTRSGGLGRVRGADSARAGRQTRGHVGDTDEAEDRLRRAAGELPRAGRVLRAAGELPHAGLRAEDDQAVPQGSLPERDVLKLRRPRLARSAPCTSTVARPRPCCSPRV